MNTTNTTEPAPDEAPREERQAHTPGHADRPVELLSESDWDQRERPPFLFTSAAHSAGFLAMLGLGWAAATGFLVADLTFNLGMNTADGDPILPFMMWLALPIAALSVIAIAVALGVSAEWAQHRPYSVMLRMNYLFLVLATLVAVLAWRSA